METNKYELAITYSQRLVRQARSEGNLSDLFKEIEEVLSVFDQQNLEKFFANNTIPEKDKANILHLFQQEISPILATFFDQIILNTEYDILYASLAEVIHHSQTAMGQYDMRVTTAVPLTSSQKLQMIAKAEKLLGLKVRQVIEEINPGIIGGFIIEVNHKIIDASVRHQLQNVQNQMK
ncbi:F0F1 ATP synthase subunit delta [Streptococcus moroccensis]|uniref:ATP synthase subunit delta n=1 Tax=Streptococcus moroccensis TaxID=1451356 RepID=A0ABT9YPI4_9STRE|nr:F0F1 ATP synthase subunit delta [Streptococcus moroccensis]MDQ0221894.1 F-type H+-transporting ATPase subunit delta [Streptococcus moroccensis]